MVNEAFLDKMESGHEKQAQDAVNEYVRVRIREDGFWRRILPPVQITNDELDRQVDTDKPVKVVDKEPESPAAASIPFATLPFNRYIRGPRFRVMFARIVTPRFTKDVDELRTYDMDIRQVLSDNSIKDMLAEEDGKAIATIDGLLLGANVVIPELGVPLHRTIAGGVTRDNLAEAMKTLPKSPNHLNTATVLINNVTIWEIVKFGRDEVGGDLSEELLRTGFAEREFLGARFIITIKRDLVPDNTIYMFAEPKFLGKFYTLEDTTMYIDRKAYMLEFFAYETIGSSIANVAAIGRVDFTA
jgi:hypothetical protein